MSNVRSFPETHRFVDLFAGVGGFHHALSELGGRCVQAVELDKEARAVYQESFGRPPGGLVPDIRSLTRAEARHDSPELPAAAISDLVPDHDVLCAGFPCQPFSKSGHQEGVRDRTRGTLFFDVMSIVLAKRPAFVMLENVRNLAGPRHAGTWRTIVQSLWEAGYAVSDVPVVLSPHRLPEELGGSPQSRDRVFVLARRVGEGEDVYSASVDLLHRFEQLVPADSPEWDISAILEADTPLDRYGIRPEEETWLAAWQGFVRRIPEDTLPGFPIWVDAFHEESEPGAHVPRWKADFLRKNRAFYLRNAEVIDGWLEERWGPLGQRVEEFPASRRKFEWQARKAQPGRERDLEELVVHFRPSGVRVKPATHLPALVAITQTSVLGPKVTGTDWRRLSPREAAKLQRIPFDGFERAGVSDKTIYKQLGNAVNVGVVQYLAKALFEAGDAPWLDALAELTRSA